MLTHAVSIRQHAALTALLAPELLCYRLYHKKKKYKYCLSILLCVCVSSEEGLATLNTLLSSDTPWLTSPALSYYAQCRAMHLGFTDLFRELRHLVPSAAARWAYCFRCKRGLRDTSVPGSLGKDSAYLAGVFSRTLRI